jgi:ABC-2 type transport system permease protein
MSRPSRRTAAISAFVRVVLRQIVSDRTTLFFFVVLPVAVIVIIGATFGTGGSLAVGVHRGSAPSEVTDGVIEGLDAADGVVVIEFDSVDELRGQVRRQVIGAGLVFADDTDRAVAEQRSAIDLVIDPTSQVGLVARTVVVSAIADTLAPLDAARFAADASGATDEVALATAQEVQPSLEPIGVAVTDIGSGRAGTLSDFALTAPQNLVLFVFINATAGGAALVRMRRAGVLRRSLAGSVSPGDMVLGLVAAWFAMALFQSVLIIGVGALLFGVDWGDPLAAVLLTTLFALAGAGAGILVGSLGRDADRVSAISPPVGIALGALGGCMVPLEVFPPAMLAVAHAVPQYWAMTAWQQLVFDGDGAGAIVVPLAALTAFAVALVGSAAAVLRRLLLSGA